MRRDAARAAAFLWSLLVLVTTVLPAAGQETSRTVPADGLGRSGRAPEVGVTQPSGPSVQAPPALQVRAARPVRWGTTAAEMLAVVERRAAAVTAGGPALPKLDAQARLLLGAFEGAGKNGASLRARAAFREVALAEDAAGRLVVDLFIQLAPGRRAADLDVPGLERRSQTGDIVVGRAPVSALRALAADPAVRFVEVSRRSWITMKASRAEIRADQVHAGTSLPAAYRGEGVVVGVLDSGIDFTHPDFSDDRGTRIRYLLEFTEDGGQRVWTKAEIDANPAAVTERDGNGGHGHGTHVAGTAAGGGRFNPAQRGIAPGADIIFVKGIRDPDSRGGFSDADVIDGCAFVFEKAAAMGKPAVINLSLGGNFGALDGSSLYEQALSSLVGPGRIIVAAAGNEGYDLIHAGGTSTPGVPNLTLALPDADQSAWINLWYDPGVLDSVAVVAFSESLEGDLEIAASTGWVAVGSGVKGTLTLDGVPVGDVDLDAVTVRDAQNGDGNVLIQISGSETVDLSKYRWGILSQGGVQGRVDLWTGGGAFQSTMLGLSGVTEMPGNTAQTVGVPSTARRILSVGSYVTSNTWTSVDGHRMEWRNPNPGDPYGYTVPALGQHSYFSSKGPTRDGRTAPAIAAPGEFIFSALSSHLSEGDGYRRNHVLEGGRYVGMQGTSMATPHVTGVVALMLQAYPRLDFEEVRAILQATARTDGHTGAVPNNRFGGGRVDALAALQQVVARYGAGGGVEPGTGGTGGSETEVAVIARNFDPAGPQRSFSLDRVLPVDSGFVAGTNLYLDRSKATLLTLPEGRTGADLAEVKVWFSYRRPGTDAATYALEVYNGSATSGPVGAPLFRSTYSYGGVRADDDFATAEAATVHTLPQPVRVGSTFFVSVDFGSYTAAEAGNLAIATTDLVGRRVQGVWDRLDNGAWVNTADAWDFGGGTGTNGFELWVEAATRGRTATATEDGAAVPTAYSLAANYPNPFNPATTIAYELAQAGPVHLVVYDLLGRAVRTLVDAPQAAGAYEVAFDARDLPSGLYLYRIEAGVFTATRTMMLVK